MIRIFCLLIALVAATGGAGAQEYISDAFGLAPAANLAEGERSQWAGLQERLAKGKNLPARVISPGASETLLAFVGPKSAVAGKDKVHAVAIALDRVGNAVSDNSDVMFHIGEMFRTPTTTMHGVAGTLFLPPPRSGFFHVGAMSDQRQSARAEFRVVPDLDSISLSLPASPHPHLPEVFLDVRTSELRDRFGNTIGDGVALQFRLNHSDGTSSLATGVTITDTGHVRLLTRALYPSANMRVELGRKVSASIPFSLRHLAAIVPPDIHATQLPEIGAVRLRIGPFVTSAGHMLNDGAPIRATVQLRGQTARHIEGWLRDGMFDTVLPARASQLPATVTVETEIGRFDLSLDRLTHEIIEQHWGME